MKSFSIFKSAVAVSIALSFLTPPVAAQQDNLQLEILNACRDDNFVPQFAGMEEARAWFIAEAINDGLGSAPVGAGGSAGGAGGPSGLGLGLGLGLNAPQTVYVSFDTGSPQYTASLFGFTLTLDDYVYTSEDREIIISRLEADYAPYNIDFVIEEPSEGDYVTLQFNSNDAPGAGTAGILPSGGILFGSAGEIDFGNDNRSIVAINDANLWPFLNALDIARGAPEGLLLERNTGIDVIGIDEDGPTAVSATEAARIAVINQSSNTGAHELGHGLGLRHYDAYGPVGGGLPPRAPEPTAFFPSYENGQNAEETYFHLMASNASSGLSLAEAANQDRFLSERSAIKLAINERGRFVTDEQANSGQASLKRLNVVNPILEGVNAEGRFDVRNIVIEGRINNFDEVDSFTFNGKADQVFNAEMISDVESAFTPDFDGLFGRLNLFLQEDDGSLTFIATNDDEFESYDAFMLDVTLPKNATYVLQMDAPANVFLGGQLVPLAAFGSVTELALRIGQYITNVYIVESKNGEDPQKIGGPRG
jgi:hypothetical protein